jgi:hypothetical protein
MVVLHVLWTRAGVVDCIVSNAALASLASLRPAR